MAIYNPHLWRFIAITAESDIYFQIKGLNRSIRSVFTKQDDLNHRRKYTRKYKIPILIDNQKHELILHKYRNEEYQYVKGIFKYWFRNGKLHRDYDLPAFINIKHKVKIWYRNGVIHRGYNRPAVKIGEKREILKVWIVNGIIHRDHGPAYVETNSSTRKWLKNDFYHRYNGKPAVIDFRHKAWYENGLCHRVNDKPAQIYTFIGKNSIWYINGRIHRDGAKPAWIAENGREDYYTHGTRREKDDNRKFKLIQRVYGEGDYELNFLKLGDYFTKYEKI